MATGSGASRYWVYQRNGSAGESWRPLPGVAGCCQLEAQYLNNGDWYEFKVAATNASGESGTSNAVSARPLPPLPAPPCGRHAFGLDLPCEHSPYYQIVCFGFSPGGSVPMTIGDVLFYPNTKDGFYAKLECESYRRLAMLDRGYTMSTIEWQGPHLLWHELVHSYQWARFRYWWEFAALYLADHMYWEREANLYWGGYASLPNVGWCDY
ncbi:hypothetical protein [Allorhizocola rhizosphaerae]|uniref:hypothetical protein n=1 Tax=Allorhizocola rhizosphaerae TaxID=1872709 RepID=UPI0013C34AAC|nr:hypothetical protein [Allorhizocola rhizosphaerae]